MKYNLTYLSLLVILSSCTNTSFQNSTLVKDMAELNQAIRKVEAGDEIVLANGIWKDVAINFYGLGSEEKPITLRAETPGSVFIEGTSYLHLGGEHLIVDGLFFRNGHSPKSAIIRYMIGEDSIAFNSRVTNTVLQDFTKPSRLSNDRWIEFYGKHNQLDRCYISGKSNDGETLRVFFTGNEHINNHHQIVHNYFGPRPRKGGPRAETIRVGDSKTRVSPGYVNVSNNYFKACNGEVEIISDKTNFNKFRHNIFDKCEGSLVLRHGSYATVDGNIFIGGDDSDFYGGIRIINAGHWITNNYFYKIKGDAFRTPLALMNGIPMTPLNRYLQVSDVVVAHNSWINCKSPWQIGVGQNIASADVLPVSEIRSAAPIRSTIANNIIYNTTVDKQPFINHSKMEGVSFANNAIDNAGQQYSEYNIATNSSIKMKKLNEWLYAPEDTENEILEDLFNGYQFEKIQTDIFGASRAEKNSIGAIINLSDAEEFQMDKKDYGPYWFDKEQSIPEPNILLATAEGGDLEKKIQQAASGDIIELADKEFEISSPLKINKKITLRSKDNTTKTQLTFKGTNSTPAFEMNPRGNIRLENIILQGNSNALAFEPLHENMASSYNLSINDCIIENFAHVILASKGSFADSITFENSTIRNCKSGIVLAADQRGDYNAEFVTINNCTFENIQSDVINFFRDGYDESTIGGYLRISGSTFTNCGKNEKSKVLIKTRGIINVDLRQNEFKNNPIKLVALLWGEKNNSHQNNTLSNSGTIRVQDQQKLKILY